MNVLILTGPSWLPYTNKSSSTPVRGSSRDAILREEPLSREDAREVYMEQLRRSGTSDRLNFTSKEVEQLDLLLKEEGAPSINGNVDWWELDVSQIEVVVAYGDNLSCQVAAEIHQSWLHDWTETERWCSTAPLVSDEEWAEAVEAADVILVGGASQEEVLKAAFLAGDTPVWGQVGTGFRGYHARGIEGGPDYGVIN